MTSLHCRIVSNKSTFAFKNRGYRMVSASTRALRFILRARAVIKFRLASSEHSRIMQLASSEYLVNSSLAAILFCKISHFVCQVYCFNLHIASIALLNNTYVNFCSLFYSLVLSIELESQIQRSSVPCRNEFISVPKNLQTIIYELSSSQRTGSPVKFSKAEIASEASRA